MSDRLIKIPGTATGLMVYEEPTSGSDREQESIEVLACAQDGLITYLRKNLNVARHCFGVIAGMAKDEETLEEIAKYATESVPFITDPFEKGEE